MIITIPKISHQVFWQKIKTRKYESLSLIASLENFFQKTRGYVIAMPPPKTPVILLVSGGPDSLVTWGLLLKVYRLRVYPLFLIRNEPRAQKQLESVNAFYRIYQRRYPALAKPPVKYTITYTPPELMEELRKPSYYHPKRLLSVLDRAVYAPSSLPGVKPQRVLPVVQAFYAVVYANYLRDHRNQTLHHIFLGVVPNDGLAIPSQTLTSLRSTLAAVCSTTADYRWQVMSLAFEPALGHWLNKDDLVRLGTSLELPLEQTWSCYNARVRQCGICTACANRRRAFAAAGVPDRTKYATSVSRMLSDLKKRAKSLTTDFPLLYDVYRAFKHRG